MELISLVLFLIGVITSGSYFDKAILLIFASGIFALSGGLYSISSSIKGKKDEKDDEEENQNKSK